MATAWINGKCAQYADWDLEQSAAFAQRKATAEDRPIFLYYFQNSGYTVSELKDLICNRYRFMPDGTRHFISDGAQETKLCKNAKVKQEALRPIKIY